MRNLGTANMISVNGPLVILFHYTVIYSWYGDKIRKENSSRYFAEEMDGRLRDKKME